MAFPVGHVAAHGTPTGMWANKPAARPCVTHADFRARCDSVLNLFDAGRAPAHMPEENQYDYRRRLLATVQPYALKRVADDAVPFVANTDLRRLAVRHLNDALLEGFETQFYDETEAAFKEPKGPLRMVTITDAAGRPRNTFHGAPCWDDFKPEVCQRISGVNPAVFNIGRGADAPGAVVPVSVTMSDGTTRQCGYGT